MLEAIKSFFGSFDPWVVPLGIIVVSFLYLTFLAQRDKGPAKLVDLVTGKNGKLEATKIGYFLVLIAGLWGFVKMISHQDPASVTMFTALGTFALGASAWAMFLGKNTKVEDEDGK